MTNADQPQDSRLERIEAILDTVAMRLDTLTRQQTNTQHQLDDLVSTANSIFARNAIMNDVLLELRENSEQHQRNFEEHQRTTNAALQSLEAILLQLIRG